MSRSPDVSTLTLNRLSLYLRSLRHLQEQGVRRISSQELAARFHLSAAQIRKDLVQFGEFGIRGVGYEVDRLCLRLSELLGLENERPLVIVGMGNLGRALARYLHFNTSPFRVAAGVDNDPDKIGKRVGTVVIRPSSELARVVRESRAEIGILTVPAAAAQENYDALVAAGISAILNFAPARLRVAAEVPTKTVDLRIHLEELSYYLARG